MNIDQFNFKKLRLLRKFNGHTQEEFSKLLGMSQSAYARLESGYTHSWESHLKKITELLNVNPDYFFTKDEAISEHKMNSYEKQLREKDFLIQELKSHIRHLEGFKNKNLHFV